MQVAVIIPAAGVGSRFSTADDLVAPPEKNKIELDLAGRPVFQRSIELFVKRTDVVQIILAVKPDTLDQFKLRYGDRMSFYNVKIVAGGEVDRWQTVMKALEAVPDDCTHVAIHDAARPLASSDLIDRVFDAARKYNAVIPGRIVSATLKKVEQTAPAQAGDSDPLDAILGSAGKTQVKVHRVVETIDRANLVEVQTPQMFTAALLRRAYKSLSADILEGRGITDDAVLVEALGEPVYVVDGEALNIKITRPDDLAIARAFLQATEKVSAAATLGAKRLFAHDNDD